MRGTSSVALALLVSLSAFASAQTSPNGGIFAGVVVDTAGKPLRDVEVLVPDGPARAITDSAGTFALPAVAPGRYEVWFRKVGLIVVQYAWESRAGGRLEVRVRMRPLPHTLDAVAVYAAEDRTMKARSSVSGVVTDGNGVPLDGVEVQLIGAQRSTITADDGTFAFRHVAPGALLVRARLLGFSPASSRLTLEENDERTVLLRLKALATTLDEVHVTAASGYDIPTNLALKDFDERMRWRQAAGSSRLLGPERLRSIGGGAVSDLRDAPEAPRCMFGGAPVFGKGQSSREGSNNGSMGYCDACVLVDGTHGYYRPLTTFAITDLESLEYYPPASHGVGETEWTGTVAERMSHVSRECRGEVGEHPAYFVLWTKGER